MEESKRLTIVNAARTVLETFEQDEAEGFHSKDRQFAITLLRKAFDIEFPPEPTFQIGDLINYIVPSDNRHRRPTDKRIPGVITRIKGAYHTIRLEGHTRTRRTSTRFLEHRKLPQGM